MAKGQSAQKPLGRGPKAPRVQIEYDVEIGDAQVRKELAFVVGIMGDFAGDAAEGSTALEDLSDRKFISINEENFDDVMDRLKPGVDLKVENTIADDGSEMAVRLDFRAMRDFEPGRIVEQVEPLKKLLETRNKLRDLATNADKKKELEKELESILQNTDLRDSLAKELNLGKDEESSE